MDKRFNPLSHIEQIRKRQHVLEMIRLNPDWPIYVIAKLIRNELHLTLNEMSKITKKIAPQTLQKLEQTDTNPTLDTLLKLLNAFGVKKE